jgi:autotransporter translocation and assembly factor TamB
MTQPEEKKPELVIVQASVGLEEIAAIKVAEVERELIISQETLLQDIRQEEAEIVKLERGLPEQVIADTKANYPEISEIEKSLKGPFKSFSIQISLSGDKVRINLEANGDLSLKGEKSKEILKEMAQRKAAVEKAEGKLVDVKKKLQQLPHLERSVKGAVARIRLESTQEGKKILAQIQKVTLPGLPAPK